MTDTAGQSMSPGGYQQAKPVFTQAAQRSQTGGESHAFRTTAVAQAGQTVHMRVVPRVPQQSGDDARTD